MPDIGLRRVRHFVDLQLLGLHGNTVRPFRRKNAVFYTFLSRISLWNGPTHLLNSQHELREDSFALINGLRELAKVPLCKLICSFINYSCFSV